MAMICGTPTPATMRGGADGAGPIPTLTGISTGFDQGQRRSASGDVAANDRRTAG